MGIEFDIDVEIDEEGLQNEIADRFDELVKEWLESEAGEGHYECDCGSYSFDVETWENASGDIRAATVCRECNNRMEIEVDMSDIDQLRG